MQCVVAVCRKQRYVPGLSSLRQPIRGIGKQRTPFEGLQTLLMSISLRSGVLGDQESGLKCRCLRCCCPDAATVDPADRDGPPTSVADWRQCDFQKLIVITSTPGTLLPRKQDASRPHLSGSHGSQEAADHLLGSLKRNGLTAAS